MDKARSQVTGTLNRAKKTTPNLHPEETKALSQLRKDTSLMILPADKGRATVVMDRESYDDKVTSMLSDTTTYKPLPKDPTYTSICMCMKAMTKVLRLGVCSSKHLILIFLNPCRS